MYVCLFLYLWVCAWLSIMVRLSFRCISVSILRDTFASLTHWSPLAKKKKTKRKNERKNIYNDTTNASLCRSLLPKAHHPDRESKIPDARPPSPLAAVLSRAWDWPCPASLGQELRRDQFVASGSTCIISAGRLAGHAHLARPISPLQHRSKSTCRALGCDVAPLCWLA